MGTKTTLLAAGSKLPLVRIRPATSPVTETPSRSAAELQRQIATDVATVISRLGAESARTGAASSTAEFPAFVADLLTGVFQSVVNASIEQMQAYSELMSEAAKSVDSLSASNGAAQRARDRLIAQFPPADLGTPPFPPDPAELKRGRMKRVVRPRPVQLREDALALRQLLLRAARGR